MEIKDTNKVSKIMILSSGRVLLLMSKRLKKFHFPGGHVQNNETFTQAVIRETKEETNLNVSWCKIVYSNPTFCLFKGGIYPSRINLSDEHDGYVWAKIEDAHKYPLCNYTKKDIWKLQKGWEKIKKRKENNKLN